MCSDAYSCFPNFKQFSWFKCLHIPVLVAYHRPRTPSLLAVNKKTLAAASSRCNSVLWCSQELQLPPPLRLSIPLPTWGVCFLLSGPHLITPQSKPCFKAVRCGQHRDTHPFVSRLSGDPCHLRSLVGLFHALCLFSFPGCFTQEGKYITSHDGGRMKVPQLQQVETHSQRDVLGIRH